jgi:hypothetical protein
MMAATGEADSEIIRVFLTEEQIKKIQSKLNNGYTILKIYPISNE